MSAILFYKRPPKTEVAMLNLSVSKIKTFESCAKKFKYIYLEKLPRKERDYHVFGKYLHSVLELFHLGLEQDKNKNIIEWMSECQEKALETWGSKMTIEQKKQTYEICQQYIDFYLTESVKNTKYLGFEKEFYICINDTILLNGFIDLHTLESDNIHCVADYKTSKDAKYLKKDFFQLQVYAYAVHLMYPEINKVRGKYIMLRHNFEPIKTEFSLEKILEVENMLVKKAEAIQNEKLFRAVPTPLCDHCDAMDVCPDKWIKRNKKEIKKVNFKTGISDW